jgi:hypothetical protein
MPIGEQSKAARDLYRRDARPLLTATNVGWLYPMTCRRRTDGISVEHVALTDEG